MILVSDCFAAIPIRISYLADFATGVVAGVVVALALGFYYVFYRYRRYGQCYCSSAHTVSVTASLISVSAGHCHY